MNLWQNYLRPKSLAEALDAFANAPRPLAPIAGGTDLMVEIRNGKWAGLETVLDISRISGLDQIGRDENQLIHIGALVTHNDVLRSPLLREYAFPLVQACARVASPQLRNRGTISYGFSGGLNNPELGKGVHGHNERVPVESFRLNCQMVFEVTRRMCEA